VGPPVGNRGWAATLTGLKHGLEEATVEKVFETHIETTPERLWEAITNPDMRKVHTIGATVESDYGGRPMILSGLKTLLETGEHLTTPGSLRYEGAGSAA
jgi:hypothetical protein